MLPIKANVRNICFFGSGSYIATLSYTETMVFIASVSGLNISSNGNYSLNEVSNCNGITIINDYDCYIACDSGVYRYLISANSISYIGQTY